MSTEINFDMPLPTIDDVLFDVELHNVYSEYRLPDKTISHGLSHTAKYKAVVNQKTGEIISVVGSNYKLISNKSALEIGKHLFKKLYPNVDPNALIPFKVVAPKTMGSAHIDLIHKDVNFDVWEQDQWLPFIRTTNSYNRTYALSFEIGFVRKLCSNGVLFNKKSLELKYYHSKENKFEIQNDVSKIIATTKLFTDQCAKLALCKFPKEMIVPLIFQALNVNLELPGESQIIQKLKNLNNLVTTIRDLTDLYFGAIGDNTYAVLNVMTDLISHQDLLKCLPGYYLHVRSYYTKPTAWMDDFSNKMDANGFAFDKYLSKTIVSLNNFNEKTKFEWSMN